GQDIGDYCADEDAGPELEPAEQQGSERDSSRGPDQCRETGDCIDPETEPRCHDVKRRYNGNLSRGLQLSVLALHWAIRSCTSARASSSGRAVHLPSRIRHSAPASEMFSSMAWLRETT